MYDKAENYLKKSESRQFIAPATAQALSVHKARQSQFLLIAIALPVFLLALIWAQAVSARGAPESFADLAERLLPAVVNISTTQIVKSEQGNAFPQFPPGHPFEDFFKDFGPKGKNGKERKATSLGSGFVISKKGLIITNNHVIDGAHEIHVIFQNGDKVPAKLVGTDPKTDIAVLKIKAKKRNLVALSWGNSNKSRVGDWVMAIGNPFGLGGTVTAGIISARGRDIRSGPYDDYIQTDASINKGNSGGPLFNMKGEIVGINTAIFSQSGGSIGIGFAVPSALARPVVKQLIKFGQTRRGWLGVRIQNVTEELAEGLELDNTDGVLVAGVPNGSPAKAAGIKAGDVILRFKGAKVAETRELSRLVAETPVGSVVKVVIWRKGRKLTKTVTLGELEKAETRMAANGNGNDNDDTERKDIKRLGMTLVTISRELRKKFKLADDVKGVVVTAVEDGSEAAEKSIKPGDIIEEIQLKPVGDLRDAKRRFRELNKAGKKSVLLLIKRGRDSRFIALSLKKKN